MSLAELVANEFHVALDSVMLLRHSSESVKKLLATGGTVEDYTFTQPTGTAYDYAHPNKQPIERVIVIVQDRVYAVYRVLGIEKEGTTYSLTSAAHQRFDVERSKPPRPARRFLMQPLSSTYTGLAIHGWEGGRSRTAVQRSGGAFFSQISVSVVADKLDSTALNDDLDKQIAESLASTPAQRKQRLTLAPKLPRRIEVTTTAFLRNADVIAEVLLRANGICELCRTPAPFLRKKDRSPYLEVHHRIRLTDGGEDTTANAIAICPNCHRREHYA
ncbi:HNH endonuclease [Stutzerimonas nitrititolerans]|uniref:HNH endonuclease n=1 Tax=Stutzerimonas nitrititolerans TaxID=2482751 RepID=UPI002896EE4F|nr:HNH endonuclease signature motif containing protein [Stutzerimonas nitrititolerans]